jgi:cation:H+ antiporter
VEYVRPVGLLAISLIVILSGCELFTNAIEWLGRRLRLGEGAVGSVLAAVGTAMPETLIPIIAFITAALGAAEQMEARHGIGIGAVVGAPLLLSTLAIPITGIAVLSFSAARVRETRMEVDPRVMGRDLRFFFLVYAVALGASFLPWRWSMYPAAALLVGFYMMYVWRTWVGESVKIEALEMRPLLFRRSVERPGMEIILAQLVAGLTAIVLGAYLFVDNLGLIATKLGVSPLVLSIVIAPIATELPEKFNSITWVRHGRDTLAIGNITGAMVFQSSLPPAAALLFGAWHLSGAAIAAVACAMGAALFGYIELKIKRRLSPSLMILTAVFYVIWLVYAFRFGGH